jgi:cyanophycin synthetase
MKIDLEDLADKESHEVNGFNERLLSLLPGLAEHYCSRSRPGGFVERLQEGTYFGHIVEHAAIELTRLVGIPVNHGKTRYTGKPGLYNIAIEYQLEKGTKQLLELAVEVVESLVRGEVFHLEEKLQVIERLIARTKLGPSTQAIVDAAVRSGIPHVRIGEESLVQLGYGIHRRFIQAAMTSRTSAIAVDLAGDKELTKTLLREAGIKVPDGMLVESEAEAVSALDEVEAPVVIKPHNGCQGKGVSLNLISPAQVERAYRIAKQYSPKVVVERQLSGRDYRVLVINGKMVAASERISAHVIGDGVKTIAELVETTNQHPDRGDGHEKSLTRIVIDTGMMEYLRKSGLSLNYKPQVGEIIFLRECANLSAGGIARDITNLVHPDVADMCERAARIIGLDICGIDLITGDIGKPLNENSGIVEINAAPGLRMHLSPSEGESRDVGDAIIETLYPDGSSGRIPVISITGTNGKTTITRMIGHVIAQAGKTVGMATTDGIFIGDRRVVDGDTTGPRSARAILADPAVEVAVLETARGGIVRGGLGYDWSDISVMSNVRLDHVGQDGIKNLDDLLFIKSLVAERVRAGGTLVLNADDERLAQLKENSRIKRVKKKVVFFSMHPHHVLIRRHLDAGGVAYLYKDGWIIEVEGVFEKRIICASEIPVTLNGTAGFQIANALAATAVCRAYDLSAELIAAALRSFSCDLHNVGRAGLYQIAGKYVLVDYGHNPDAFGAICRMTDKWKDRLITGIIGVPGDRDDKVIEQAGRVVARGFHRIIVKEDKDLRGRRPGEVADLLHQAIHNEAPERECRIVLDETEALQTALNESGPGEVIVIFYEKIDPVTRILAEVGAKPVESIPDRHRGTVTSDRSAVKKVKTDRRFAQA